MIPFSKSSLRPTFSQRSSISLRDSFSYFCITSKILSPSLNTYLVVARSDESVVRRTSKSVCLSSSFVSVVIKLLMRFKTSRSRRSLLSCVERVLGLMKSSAVASDMLATLSLLILEVSYSTLPLMSLLKFTVDIVNLLICM